MTVKAILSRKGSGVLTIEPAATLAAAIATLAQHRIGALVVLGAVCEKNIGSTPCQLHAYVAISV